jgi:hypothetical protein
MGLIVMETTRIPNRNEGLNPSARAKKIIIYKFNKVENIFERFEFADDD